MNLKTSFHWTMHSILAFRVSRVQGSARDVGGYCIWPFSQLSDPVKSLICSHSSSSGGICEMLAAKWLEEHAKGGSIVNWMTKADGDIIDANKVRQLMQLFTIGCTMRSGAMVGTPDRGSQDQTQATEKWLRSRGIIRRRQITGGFALLGGSMFHQAREAGSQRGRTNRLDFSEAIARQIIQSNGSYKMIGIEGSHFAHAMAAWSDQDVSFFDPNFGEFWFARPQDFVAWLPTFWHLAGYDTPALGLSESYTIQEYGMPL